ncbi:restriction endonuclease subunit S [Streptococcus suis]|uniref:restriction endonuclease subunit S n=1 Tax=Streptococcus suis TaxID=1307 RepID=UPI002412E1FA|nr:restriction endonuclease subunit S [Streptococcus suis]MDG4500795.1 restriction endonuclease subunit S [Streptococcus suis]
MKTNNNIPAYRFQGYTDAWELRKLGEVAEIIGGGTPSTSNSEFWDGDIDWYTPAEIGEQIYVDGSERKITQLGLDKSSATLLPANKTILFTSRAGIGKTAILRSDATTNQGFQSIVVDNNTEPYFIFSMTDKIKNKAISVASGSTFAEISSRALGQLEFMFPSINEQSAIGTFFSTLDQHIALHQRKLDTLKEQKKTYLKLLFPAKGQTKPALRFQGFEDDWEEVKLGEVVEKSGSGGTPKSTNKAYYGGNIPFLSITDITQSGKYITNTEKTLTEIGLENSSAWKVPKGAISLAMYASVGKLAILKTDVATSQAFFNMVFSNEIVRDYVYFILDKAQLFNEWLPLISTGTQGNLNAQKLKEYIIPLPTLPEQEAIGSFFSTLDQEIAQVEDKLASLKEMKKTLLRKLFV